jgi:hypothetical protein
MRIIDLSQDIYEGMKVYPGHLKTVQFEHATHEETAPRFEGGFSFQTTGSTAPRSAWTSPALSRAPTSPPTTWTASRPWRR